MLASGQAPAQKRFVEEVFAQLLSVENDHGHALEVGAVQRVVCPYVELAQLEVVLGLEPSQSVERLLAEMAVGMRVDLYDAHVSSASPLANASSAR
jgi:hypothetical protein